MNTAKGLIPAKTYDDHIADAATMGLSSAAAALYAGWRERVRRTRVSEQPYAFDAYVSEQQGLAREGYVRMDAIDELIRWHRTA